jgi:hypothetical protein
VECGTALGHLAVSDVAARPYRFRRYGRDTRLQGRAALLFDEVVVCVMFNSNKTGRFPIIERLDRLRCRNRW